MTSRPSSQIELGRDLAERMSGIVRNGVPATPSPGATMQAAFENFGWESATHGSSQEDTFAMAVDVLQEVFQLAGGPGNDHSNSRAAGIALASVARGYARDRRPAPDTLATSSNVSQRIAWLSALHQINRAATSQLQVAEMLERVVAVVAEATRSDACDVFLYDDATGLLTLSAAVGLNLSSVNAVTIRAGSGITGMAAQSGDILLAPVAREHPNFLAHPAVGDEVYTSQASVPIYLSGSKQLIGVLNVHSIERRELGDGDIEFLRTVAVELAYNIENARRYSSTDERLRQKVAELGTLQRVSRLLASTLELPDVLRMISEQAIELINAEAAAIFRFPHTAWQRNTPGSPTIEHRVGSVREIVNANVRDDLVKRVVAQGSALSSHIEYVDGPATLLCLPLRTARETVGALCFRLPHNQFPDSDALGLVQAFCDSAAMAIENAQLYQNAMNSVQTQSALVQEMHHRVRNNLQTVAALLSLQLRTSSDAPWATEIREAISRIQSIAAVHDLLSDEQRLGGTTVDVIARLVAEDAHSTLIPPGKKVDFRIEPSSLRVPTRQATIISLLINELAANAISHGFNDRPSGAIRIRGWEEAGYANIEVFNDGQRVPDGFDPAQSSGLGMRITQRLVTSDLKGTFAISSSGDGTRALIRFPIMATEDQSDLQASVPTLGPP